MNTKMYAFVVIVFAFGATSNLMPGEFDQPHVDTRLKIKKVIESQIFGQDLEPDYIVNLDSLLIADVQLTEKTKRALGGESGALYFLTATIENIDVRADAAREIADDFWPRKSFRLLFSADSLALICAYSGREAFDLAGMADGDWFNLLFQELESVPKISHSTLHKTPMVAALRKASGCGAVSRDVVLIRPVNYSHRVFENREGWSIITIKDVIENKVTQQLYPLYSHCMVDDSSSQWLYIEGNFQD